MTSVYQKNLNYLRVEFFYVKAIKYFTPAYPTGLIFDIRPSISSTVCVNTAPLLS